MSDRDEYVQDLFDMIDGEPDEGIGPILEPIRQYLCDLSVTVITMYRGHAGGPVDAEMFTMVVEGELTAAQRDAWRKDHFCDEYFEGDEDDCSNMFFRFIKLHSGCWSETVDGNCPMVNVAGPEEN